MHASLREIPMQTHKFNQWRFVGFYAVAFLVVRVQIAQASSPSIQLVATNRGKVATAGIKTYAGKTYICGVVFRRTNWAAPHVHIVLVDSKGHAFASKSTELSGWQGKPSTDLRGTYTASFDPSEVAKATTVQITFLGNLHVFCKEAQPPSES